jgi:hypothetical protein
MKFLPTLLLTLSLFIPGVRSEDTPTANRSLVVEASDNQQVWVNTATGVYHYPGTRWYGNTKQGEFMSEEEAREHGYRAAKNGQMEG